MIVTPSPIEFPSKTGFTLIEMSIVLVIIGLIIGGVLVGRDLINASAIRAQISQVEKYNSAINTFRGKYGYLPGDIPDPTAQQYGLKARGALPGEGDGNGLVEGYSGAYGYVGTAQGIGETTLFWVDLSTATLLDGGFNTAVAHFGSTFNVTGPGLDLYLPKAKIGQANYIYAYSENNSNYYGVSAVTAIIGWENLNSNPALSVEQSFNIDKKMDDGAPQSGRVVAKYVNFAIVPAQPWPPYPIWAAGGGALGVSDTSATAGSATTCYDNGGVAGVQHYSIEQSGGANMNCALSFRFQ